MIDLFQARRESHEARELGHEFKIQEGGVSLEVPRVEGQAFYPSGDAPRMTRDGTPMENIKEGLADLPKAVGSAGAGLAAGAAGLPGDLVGLAGGLAKFMFPGDQGRIEAAAETLSKISETAGSEFFLGLYRDFVNNSDASLEDKQMMLDVAEGASFGSIPGAGAVAKGSADTIRSGVVKAGEAAQARLDEAAGSTTLAAGVDVGKGIDQAIAAAGKAVVNNDMILSEAGKAAIEDVGSIGSNIPLTKTNLEKADEVTQLLVSKILEANPDVGLSLVRSGSAAGKSNYLTFATPEGKMGQIRISDHSKGVLRSNDYLGQFPMKMPPEGEQVFGQISRKSFDRNIDEVVKFLAPAHADP